MIGQTVGALGSGSLVGFTLGLIGGGGSILATPLLLYVVGVAQPHIAVGTGGMLLATKLSGRKDVLNRIFATLIFAVAAYVLYRSGMTLFREVSSQGN